MRALNFDVNARLQPLKGMEGLQSSSIVLALR